MTRGGKRANAGRPQGSGRYGEQTQAIRVPVSMLRSIKQFIASKAQSLSVPMFGSTIQAGFPSPADDYSEGSIDFNQYLVKHQASTFCVKVAGQSMIGAGIYPGDILVVDKSLTPSSGKIVVAVVEGEFTVKRFLQKQKQTFLMPENDAFAPIEITEEIDAVIWGVVIHVIRSF